MTELFYIAFIVERDITEGREVVVEAGSHFDGVVAKILDKDFSPKSQPEYRVCKECDFRAYCQGEGACQIKMQAK